MMGLETLIALNGDIGRQAARLKLKPHVPASVEEIEQYPPFPFPNFGFYLPKGWEVVQSWFCDKTGWGLDSERALSLRQLRDELAHYVAENPGHGFAITEEGQFQLIVSAFRRV